MSGTVVLCIGNPFRRDDGVGSAVAAQVRGSLPAGVRLVELDGEPARVVDAWAGADLAIVVDAARSSALAGTVRRIDVITGDPSTGPAGIEAARAGRPASSHGYSLRDAVELGAALGRVPARLVLYAVGGRDFANGPGLSDPVADAVPVVAARVVEEAMTAAGAPAHGSGAG